MPVYNGEKFIGEAIKSVLNQKFKDYEYLIVEDKSTDQSLDIIREYKNKDSRITIIRNKSNLGIQKTLNKGIRLSQGEYIARIDCDDVWSSKNKLGKQVKFLEQNPNYGVVGTNIVSIDNSGKELNRIRYKEADSEIRKNLLLASQMAHPSVLIRKKALDEVGCYREDKKYKHAEDYELWLRIGTRYKLANLPDFFLKYRINPSGVSLKNELSQRMASLRVTLKYKNQYPNAFKAIFLKITTLPLPRFLLDKAIKKNNFFGSIYSRLTGIQKR